MVMVCANARVKVNMVKRAKKYKRFVKTLFINITGCQ
jgi:hypothetical protein